MTPAARSPFLALLQLEVSRSSTIYANPLAWLMAAAVLAANLVPALLLWRQPEFPLFLLMQEAWVSMTLLWWLTMLIMECSNSQVRGVWQFLTPAGTPAAADEFLYSRAIDRALHFRAKTVMLTVYLVLPILLNFGLVCVVSRQFPPGLGAFLAAAPEELTQVPSGEIAAGFAGAMIWLSLTAVVLAQGYYGLASHLAPHRHSIRAAVLAGLPVLLAIGGFWALRLDGAWKSDWEHDGVVSLVRFIARHWMELTLALAVLALPVQRFCERNFAEQEVL